MRFWIRLAGSSLAQAPQLFNSQGKLFSGAIPMNGRMNMTFKLHAAPAGDGVIWFFP